MSQEDQEPSGSKPSGRARADGLVGSFRAVEVANERLLASTSRGWLRTISDPHAPAILKIQLVYATLCALSFSVCCMFFCINALGTALQSWPLEIDHYLIFLLVLLIIFVVPMMVVTMRASAITNTYDQLANLDAVTSARQFHKRSRPVPREANA